MTMKRTIGGDRLGSGSKMTVDMKTYERSTHDLSYIWRSTMAAGTLVPFMTELALPGDTFDINLDCNVMTHPTVGPLFGSYKVQLDVFCTPIRLYHAQLHQNQIGIGLNMASIKLPQIEIECASPTGEEWKNDPDNIQINPSCLLSYLNIRGIGLSTEPDTSFTRQFNALPYLTYWDIYKNYYANKQEEIGALIHNVPTLSPRTIDDITTLDPVGTLPQDVAGTPIIMTSLSTMDLNYTGDSPIANQIYIWYNVSGGGTSSIPVTDLFKNVTDNGTDRILCNEPYYILDIIYWTYATTNQITNGEPQVFTFPLLNIDAMKNVILKNNTYPNPIVISSGTLEPYGLPLASEGTGDDKLWSKNTTMEGLALKTYQSDLFNNWIQTEWLDGTNGINEITSIDTSGGSFTIDQLNLSKKVYDMLNRIAISGGTYDDWLDTVYTHNRFRSTETPVYMGGLIKELVFQEVVSNAEASGEGGTQPLGTLGGKGIMSKKHKGGHIVIKVDEPSYITGIISLTPRLDYSQGNKWDVNIKTMDDLHKPALDEIGFQELITDQMAWWDTKIDASNVVTFKSAGKQPAWINYMTNVNQARGNFAIKDNEMFMTLNRKYEINTEDNYIKDLTTYIDPVKYNNVFAQTERDAQNFWTQIGVDITARRKMSARIIPNL